MSLAEAEERLAGKYKGKYCSLSLPGYNIVYGKVDEISIEMVKEPIVVIQMNHTRYTVSIESLKDCLKTLR